MSQRDGDLFERASEFLAMFRRGAEFTRELVEENARLRRKLLDLETRQNDAAQDPKEWDRLREELVERFLEIEEENNGLANLYVASYQLHSTLDLQEVLRIVVEIVINLIGAEVLCVYALDERNFVLSPVAAEGRERASFPAVALGEGLVGASVARGEILTREALLAAD